MSLGCWGSGSTELWTWQGVCLNVQEAEGILVAGCFKDIAGRLIAGCLGNLTVLIIKQEQLLLALPLCTAVFKKRSALLG